MQFKKILKRFGKSFKHNNIPKKVKNVKKNTKAGFFSTILIFIRNIKIIKDLVVGLYSVIKFISFGFISDTKKILDARHRAAKNNYIIGLEMLKDNYLADAKIRFLLSNLFYKKSWKTKYYLAYLYHLEGNYVKSLKFLKESVSIKPNMKIAHDLLVQIEKDMKLFGNRKIKKD